MTPQPMAQRGGDGCVSLQKPNAQDPDDVDGIRSAWMVHQVPSTGLSILQVLSQNPHVIFILQPYFTDENTEANHSFLVCLRSFG